MKAHSLDGQFARGKRKDSIVVDNPAIVKIIDCVPLGTRSVIDADVWAAKLLFVVAVSREHGNGIN